MDICSRTLLPASDTFLGIAATGALVSLIAHVTLGPAFQVAISLLYFFVSWALTVGGALVVLLPFGTCQLAILIDYMEYGVAFSLSMAFFNIAILLLIGASTLSSCLGAWDTLADQFGDEEHWREECRDRIWLATITLLAIKAAKACKEGMELPTKSQGLWRRLFWLWPRFIHNHIKVFRRLGSWAVAFELKRCGPSQMAENSDVRERIPLISGGPANPSYDSTGGDIQQGEEEGDIIPNHPR